MGHDLDQKTMAILLVFGILCSEFAKFMKLRNKLGLLVIRIENELSTFSLRYCCHDLPEGTHVLYLLEASNILQVSLWPLFQSSRWHSLEQYDTRLHRAHLILETRPSISS